MSFDYLCDVIAATKAHAPPAGSVRDHFYQLPVPGVLLLDILDIPLFFLSGCCLKKPKEIIAN